MPLPHDSYLLPPPDERSSLSSAKGWKLPNSFTRSALGPLAPPYETGDFEATRHIPPRDPDEPERPERSIERYLDD